MLTKEEAQNRYCPFKQGIIQCKVEMCMGWETYKEDDRYGYCRPLGKGITPPKKAKPLP